MAWYPNYCKNRLNFFTDLSFNNIEKIEGLDKLVNLTDISIYNNKI